MTQQLQLRSYRELFFSDNEQEIVGGALQDRCRSLGLAPERRSDDTDCGCGAISHRRQCTRWTVGSLLGSLRFVVGQHACGLPEPGRNFACCQSGWILGHSTSTIRSTLPCRSADRGVLRDVSTVRASPDPATRTWSPAPSLCAAREYLQVFVTAPYLELHHRAGPRVSGHAGGCTR